LAAVSLAAGEFRDWNVIGGGQFEAKLNAVKGTSLVLENREGKVVDYPIGNLMLSDQQFARDWQLARTTSGDGASPSGASVEQSDFAKTVYRDLVRSQGSRLKRFTPDAGDSPKYFAFYRSAMWCPPCRKFTPKLVKFYNKQKRKGAPFELVFISSDRSEDDMAEYMKQYKMKWPAFKHGKNKDIVQRNGTGIPNLIVTDADGNKLLDSYDAFGKFIGPSAVMRDFEKLLAAE
jgi:nucleoredoxin